MCKPTTHTPRTTPMSTPTRLRSRGAVSRPPRSPKTPYNTTRANATYSKMHRASAAAARPVSRRHPAGVNGRDRPAPTISPKRSSIPRRPQPRPLTPRRMRCRRTPALRGSSVHEAHDRVPFAIKQRWWTAHSPCCPPTLFWTSPRDPAREGLYKMSAAHGWHRDERCATHPVGRFARSAQDGTQLALPLGTIVGARRFQCQQFGCV